MILGQNPHYVGNVSTEAEKQALIEKYGNQALRPAVKMSKSLGNVVNPDDVVKAYGADTMRLYIMFIGDFEKVATWSDEAVKGSKRFLDRCWNLMDMASDSESTQRKERGHHPQDHPQGHAGHRRAQDEHRHRRPHDHGQRVLRQRPDEGRPQDAHAACSAPSPRIWSRKCGS